MRLLRLMTPVCPFEVAKLMKIYLFGQRNNLGGGTHFGGFVDAMKSLAVIGKRVEEVEVSGKKNQSCCRPNSTIRCVSFFLSHFV